MKNELNREQWRERDDRFRQLLDLAREGNEDAVGDVYREYGFDYGRDEA